MKIVISESQSEKIRNLLYKLFDKKLYPVEGWQNVGHQIRRDNEQVGYNKKDGFGHYKGETFISTAQGDGYYNYYGCEFIKLMGLEEDTECPCLMLQDDDYYFFDKRFPADLWKPLLVDWWNEQSEYPVKAVYKF